MRFLIDCDGEAFSSSAIQALQETLAGVVDTDVDLAVELCFVDEQEIRRLNKEMRNIDKVTDVLSFPTLDGIKGQPIRKKNHPFDMDEDGRLTLGCIAICVARAKEQAIEYGHSYERELHYLTVHGIMHCLGYDHITDEERAEMREREEFVLGKLGITRE